MVRAERRRAGTEKQLRVAEWMETKRSNPPGDRKGSVANFLPAFASCPNLRQIGTTNEQQGISVTVNFKGAHYPKSVIL